MRSIKKGILLKIFFSLLILVTQERLVLSVSTQNGITPDVDKLISKSLLHYIYEDRSISEDNCFLKFLFEDSNQNSFLSDWAMHTNWPETVQQYYQVASLNQSKYQYLPAWSKFRSHCWLIVVTVRSSNILTLLNLKSRKFFNVTERIGHPIRDHYVFLSESESLLTSVMSNSLVLDAFSRKVGIFPETNLNRVGYIVEPPYFTGKMISQSHLEIQKVVNNYNGRTLRAAYLQEPPHFYANTDNQPEGPQYMMISEITRLTNHSVSYYRDLWTPGFGRLLSNGSWTGLIGEMVSGRADMATTSAPTLERSPYVDNPRSSYILPLVMSLQSPQAYRDWHALVDPLDPFVWMCTLVTFLITIVAFAIKQVLGSKTKSWRSVWELVLPTYGIFVEQMSPALERSTSKFLLILWVTFSYLIGTAYRSNLVSFLTFMEMEKVPDTFLKLYEDPSYSIILHSVGGLELDLLKNSKNSVFKGIGARMTMDPDAEACLEAAATSKSVCIAWLAFVISVMGEDTDGKFKNIFIPKRWEAFCWVGSVFRKGSIFTGTFSRYVEIMMASSLFNYWEDKTLRKIKSENRRRTEEKKRAAGTSEESSQESQPDTNHSLDVSDIFIVLVLSVGGNLLALLCFIREIFKHNNKLKILRL